MPFEKGQRKTQQSYYMEVYVLDIERRPVCDVQRNISGYYRVDIERREVIYREKYRIFVDVYTGDCVSLKTKTNSNCEDTIVIYLTNDIHKVLYLRNVNKTTTETFLCNINKVDNLEEITTVIHADIDCKQLTYTFGGIAAVLIVLLIVAAAVIKTMALQINHISRTDNLPMPTKRKESIEDEHTHDEDVVPDNVATTDSVNLQSIDLGNCSPGRNSALNPTLSRNASSYYQFDVSGNSNTEAINEQKTESVNNTDNYLNNCFENDIYSTGDLYVNTNVTNTYEQLEKNNTTFVLLRRFHETHISF